MDIEERLEKIEEAHRALVANHTALFLVCKAMLPLIPVPSETVDRLLTAAGNELYQPDWDAEFQSDARAAWAELAEVIMVTRKAAC